MYIPQVSPNSVPVNGPVNLTAKTPAQVQQTTVQPAPEPVPTGTSSPNLVMVGCLIPFCVAFLAFSAHLTYRNRKLNRWIKHLQQITTLERVLDKTPDECK